MLGAAAASTLGVVAGPVLGGRDAPAFVPSGRPVLTHGVQSGDAVAGSATVWTRADRVGRMLVEVSGRPDFRDAVRMPGPVLRPGTDFTGKSRITGLAPGRRTYYRVRVEAEHGLCSESLTGSLRMPGGRDGIRFVWTGDIAGQGWETIPTSAACASSMRCGRCGRTSSSAAATLCTPTGRSPRR